MTVRRTAFDLALVGVLGLFLAACLFAHPTADDFIYATNVRAGFWHAWAQEYLGWNGRYASNALVLGTPLVLGVAGYRVAAAVMLASTGAAVYAFVCAWAGDSATHRDALTFSLIFSALVLSQVPSLGESLYWYTSAATYQAWVLPALLHLALVMRYVRRDRRTIRDRMSLVLATVLLVAAAGFNEVVMLMLLAFYVIWFAWSLQEDAHDSWLSGAMLAVIALCGLVMLLSPGNAVRQSMYTGLRHQLGRSLAWTALQTLRFGSDWMANGALLIATVLVVPAAEQWSRRQPLVPRRAMRLLGLVVAGMFLVIPMAVFPAYWETGILGQHRTLDAAYIAFLVLWFSAVLLLPSAASTHADALKLFSQRWRAPLAVVLLAALALTRNSYALGSDFVSGRLTGFDREMRARYASLQACRERADHECDIDPIRQRPASFVVLDISTDPRDWVNAAYGRYYGLAELRLKPQSASEERRR